MKKETLKLNKRNTNSNNIILNFQTEENYQSKFSISLINNKSPLNINNNNINKNNINTNFNELLFQLILQIKIILIFI